jgi:hypothetical protein
MSERFYRVSRRSFLASTATLALGGQGDAAPPTPHIRPPQPETKGRKPIAVLTTVYRPLSHAQHIAGRFLHGYSLQGTFHVPKQYMASLYVDQKPDNDLSREIGRDHKVHLARTVSDALTMGGNKLAVEGVLLIGEHGNYSRNDKGQILYPRYEFFKEMTEVFRRTGQSVPVFNDKHLSYNWARAKEMVGLARDLEFPLMAGSSLPVTWRRPELEPALDTPIEDALVAAFGPIEVYGFHALEALQVMMERRKGGETGVKSVTCLSGKDVWKAGDEGRWSWDLLEAALSRCETIALGDLRKNVGSAPVAKMPATPALAFLVEYTEGTRGTTLLLNSHMQDFAFAAKVKGEPKPISCMYYLPQPPGARYFDALVHNIEKLFDTGKSPYPVERTLLTSGVLDAAMESHYRRGTKVETPELSVRYAAPADSGFLRGSVTSPA